MNYSSSSFSCYLSKFLTQSSFLVRESSVQQLILMGITFIIFLMSKIWSCFIETIFFYIYYSILFLSFSRVDFISNRILFISELSGVLFIFFLRGIRCWYGVTLAKLSPCLEKSETCYCPCEYLFLRFFLFGSFY